MSLVVRHKDTGQYLQAHGCWTAALESAMRFNSGLRLVDYMGDDVGARANAEQIELVVIAGARRENLAVNKGPELFS